MVRSDAIRRISITEQMYYHWRKQDAGMGMDQLEELKKLQKENDQLCRAAVDLTLDKSCLAEAAREVFQCRTMRNRQFWQTQ